MLCTRCLRTTFVRRQLPIARQFSASARFRSTEPQLSTPITEVGEEVPTPAGRSICKEGTTLNGLNFTNGGKDPIAKKDEEYPDWLWSCLDVMKKSSDSAEDDAGDEFGTASWPAR